MNIGEFSDEIEFFNKRVSNSCPPHTLSLCEMREVSQKIVNFAHIVTLSDIDQSIME